MNKTLNRAAIAAAIVLGTALAGTAMASGSAQNDLSVSAEVINSCSITTSPVDFGNYDPISSSDNTSSGGVTVTCTPEASAAILLGEGVNKAGSSTAAAPVRRLSDGTHFLSYNLYTDNTYGTVWDNDTGVPYAGTGNADAIDVFGMVPMGQLSAPAGSYSDTVVAKVTF
jgi:spore coat protein U-like protein